MNRPRRALQVAVLMLCATQATPAQSLRGSQASVERMFTRAIRTELDFYRTSKGVYQSVRDGELVLISITMDLMLEDVSYPFVLPKTRDVLYAFAKKYRAACGERLVVTSAARPRTEQPRNASPKSVHPTGMAVDFRRPGERCLTWMRKELVTLERQGILEATEERRPVHFHVAVFQRGSFAPAPAVATAVVQPTVPSRPAVLEPQTAVTATAGGDVVTEKAATKKPTPRRSTSPSTYIVRKGDNLSEIAQRFGLSVTRLRALNGIKGSTIRPGQKLRVR